MANILSLYDLGLKGVNVDSSRLHMADGELRQASNAISDPKGYAFGLKNRPGLTHFNGDAAAGSVLGGICVPLLDERTGPGDGELHLYIGTTVPSDPDPSDIDPGDYYFVIWADNSTFTSTDLTQTSAGSGHYTDPLDQPSDTQEVSFVFQNEGYILNKSTGAVVGGPYGVGEIPGNITWDKTPALDNNRVKNTYLTTTGGSGYDVDSRNREVTVIGYNEDPGTAVNTYFNDAAATLDIEDLLVGVVFTETWEVSNVDGPPVASWDIDLLNQVNQLPVAGPGLLGGCFQLTVTAT